ncbi:MAG TPA: ABC transporter ATP-binding protein [Candidatus Deferrimicrobium sp.]|nr:ABC transporter ATP-binding protein [Candidatus Deferrimicrobium sp.]
MLRIDRIAVDYDGGPAIHDVSVHVPQGAIVAVVGSNGSGKTTMLKTVAGLLHPSKGTIAFDGKDIHRTPANEVLKMGVALVPEGRKLFGKMSVRRNLDMGAYTRSDRAEIGRNLERVFRFFPRLSERISQQAGTLSGGEMQMLAIGRAMMSNPRMLMLDEPSLGIAPNLVDRIFEVIADLNAKENLTILLVEQNVSEALSLAHSGYVVQTGRTVLFGTGKQLLDSDLVRKAYLGM